MKPLHPRALGESLDGRLLAKCKAVVQAMMPRARVVLFGSRARGDARPDSDYDLMIVSAGGGVARPSAARARRAL
jgi:predicted nucleotidyltransferase